MLEKIEIMYKQYPFMVGKNELSFNFQCRLIKCNGDVSASALQ